MLKNIYKNKKIVDNYIKMYYIMAMDGEINSTIVRPRGDS